MCVGPIDTLHLSLSKILNISKPLVYRFTSLTAASTFSFRNPLSKNLEGFGKKNVKEDVLLHALLV